jgi:hypothetical protein
VDKKVQIMLGPLEVDLVAARVDDSGALKHRSLVKGVGKKIELLPISLHGNPIFSFWVGCWQSLSVVFPPSDL